MITATRQNPYQTSFKRSLGSAEFNKLLDHDLKTFIEVSHKIGTGEINAKDMPLAQFERASAAVFIRSKDNRTAQNTAKDVFNSSYLIEIAKRIYGNYTGLKAERKFPVTPQIVHQLRLLDTPTIAEVSSGVGSGKYSAQEVAKELKRCEKLKPKGSKTRAEWTQMRKIFEQFEPTPMQKRVYALQDFWAKIAGKKQK